MFAAFALPRPSEYELYHTFVFNGPDPALRGTVAERRLDWDDWGACCHDPDGRPTTTTVNVTANSDPGSWWARWSSRLSTPPVDPAASTTQVCGLDAMRVGLAKHFDFVGCHQHMRRIHFERLAKIESKQDAGSGVSPVAAAVG